MSKQENEELTFKEIYKQLRECLEAVKPSDKKLSGAMRARLDYNLYFLRTFMELQGGENTDLQAIGFEIESECDYEDNENK